MRIKIKPPCSIRFLKWPLRKSVCRGLYEVTRIVPYVEHALLCPPSCCLPCFLITLLFSQNGTYHTPAHIVSHCFTSHYLNSKSAASQEKISVSFPTRLQARPRSLYFKINLFHYTPSWPTALAGVLTSASSWPWLPLAWLCYAQAELHR